MKKIILYTLLLITGLTFGQDKYFVDRYFEEFAYKKSAELYEKIYNKGDSTSFVISRIGDSYYNNSEYIKAEPWYHKLLLRHQDEVSSEYMFKYAHVLKSNGNVSESDKWMLKFKKTFNSNFNSKSLKRNKDSLRMHSNQSIKYKDISNVSINTEYSDFGGFVYNNELYFASSKPNPKLSQKIYKWNNQPFLNIYKGEQKIISETGVLDIEAVDLIDEISSKYHESNIIFSKDGNTLYLTRDNYDGRRLKKSKKNIVHLKIYKSKKVNGKWLDLEELPFNSDDYSVGHPALSDDEKTLYFISDNPKGYGYTDIYKVAVFSNHEEYGIPQNLGEIINTEGREMFPYIDKSNTLYFSSNGHVGLGALDIFESKFLDNQFSIPINLEAPINSNLDDFAFVINDDLTKGYFSSNREGGKGDDDIYSFIVSACKENIEGTVTDLKTEEVIANAVVILVDKNGKILEEQITKEDGRYVFEKEVFCDEEYSIVASKENYRKDLKKIKTLNINNKKININLKLEALIIDNEKEPELSQIVIRPIYFDFDKSNIREDAKYELEHIVDVMKNNPSMIIKIESHTDSRGSRKYNRLLSDRRAKSTREYIYSRGIERNRIQSAIGFGEDKLLNHCDDANRYSCSEEEHQLNRRSYFYITNNVKVKVKEQKEAVNINTNDRYHIVDSTSDTLYNISNRYGLTVKKLKKLNGLTSNTILIGQKLKLK